MMSHWMFNCREVSLRISKAFDQDLTWSERLMIWIHIKMCRYCTLFEKQLHIIRLAVRNPDYEDQLLDPSVGLSQDARERIKGILQSF